MEKDEVGKEEEALGTVLWERGVVEPPVPSPNPSYRWCYITLARIQFRRRNSGNVNELSGYLSLSRFMRLYPYLAAVISAIVGASVFILGR